MDQKELYEQQILKDRGGSVALSVSLGGRERALLEWICRNEERALSQPDACIAELSIGDGQLSRALARKFPTVQIDCVDISPSRLEHARRAADEISLGLSGRMRFLELNLDTEFKRLERSHYDAVIAIDVLEHVFDPFEFVRHCREVLKPGGGIFLRVPNLAYIKRRLAILAGHLPVTSSWFETPGSYRSWKERHGWDGGHLHFFTIDSLRWLLEDEGLTCLRVDDVGASAGWLRRLRPGVFFGNLAVVARNRQA